MRPSPEPTLHYLADGGVQTGHAAGRRRAGDPRGGRGLPGRRGGEEGPPTFLTTPMTWPGTTRLASPGTLPRACPQLRSVSGLCAETHRGGAPSHDSAQNPRRATHPRSRVLDPHPCFLSLGPHPCSRALGPPTLLPCPVKPVFAAGVGKLLVFAPQSQASGIPGVPYTLPALFTYAYRWDSARGGVCAAACTHRWN